MASAKWLKNLIARILSLLYWAINIMCLALYISISFAFGIKIENSKTSLFHNTFYTGALYHIGRKMTERKFNNCNWLKTLNLINAGWTQEFDLATSPNNYQPSKLIHSHFMAYRHNIQLLNHLWPTCSVSSSGELLISSIVLSSILITAIQYSIKTVLFWWTILMIWETACIGIYHSKCKELNRNLMKGKAMYFWTSRCLNMKVRNSSKSCRVRLLYGLSIVIHNLT